VCQLTGVGEGGGEVLEQVPTKSNDDAFLSLLLKRSYLQETLKQNYVKIYSVLWIRNDSVRIMFSMSFRIRILSQNRGK
jgi:hypothetical protein